MPQRPGFYAQEDTRTPVRVAAVALGVNLAAALLLTGPLGHVGIALALSLSSWANALGLGILLWRRRLLQPDAELARRCLGILAAVGVMAAVLLAGRAGVGGIDAATLGLLIVAGALAFLVAAWIAGAIDRGQLRRLRRAARA